MTRTRLSVLLAGILLVALTLLAQSSIDDQRQELYRTREQLESVERRLADLRVRRANAQHSLMEDEDRIALIRRLSAQIEQAQREKSETIERIRRAMYDIAVQVEARKQDLAGQLVTLYKYGRMNELEILFSSGSMPEAYRKLVYLKSLAEANRRRMDELKALQDDLKAQADHFRYSAAALRGLQTEYEARQRQLQADRELRAREISSLKGEEASKEELAEQLAAAAGQLEALIRKLEAAGPAPSGTTPGTSTLRTGLPWPVAGRLQTGFGAQTTAGGAEVRSSGIVIACDAGGAVKAVAKGRVSYAEEFMEYGNLVILDHGDGSFSVYGNLQDIAVAANESVEPGDVVGHANSTIYFELRKSTGPVDPLNYLAR